MKRTTDTNQVFGDFVADQLCQLPPEKQKKLKSMVQCEILTVCEGGEQQNQYNVIT